MTTHLKRRSDRGVALAVSVAVLALLFIMAVVFMQTTRIERMAAANLVEQARAEMAAEAGLHWAVGQLQQEALADNLDGPLAGANAEAWAFPHGQDLVTANQVSWDSAFTGPLAGPVAASLTPLRKSGVVGGTFVAEGDHFLLKVVDVASQLDVNGRQQSLTGMLSVLGAQIEADTGAANPLPAGEAGQLIQFRDGLPQGMFTSKNDLLDGIRTLNTVADEAEAQRRLALLSDYVSIHGWRDVTLAQPEDDDTTVPRDSFTFEGIGRSPVNLNTAPKPVLVAILAGLGGRSLAVANVGTIATSATVNGVDSIPGLGTDRAQLERVDGVFADTELVSLDDARAIADAIIAVRDTTPFTTFERLRVELVTLATDGTISDYQASVIFSNFLPSEVLNDHNPDRFIRLVGVQKSDLFYRAPSSTVQLPSGTTEACFSSMGFYEIQSIGRVMDQRAQIQAEAEVAAVVKVFDVVRHTSQDHFVGAIDLATGTDFSDLDVELFPEPLNQGVSANLGVGLVSWRASETDVLGALTMEADFIDDLGHRPDSTDAVTSTGKVVASVTGGGGDLAPDGMLSFRTRGRQINFDPAVVEKALGSAEFFVKLMTEPEEGTDEVLFYASRSFAELGLAAGVTDQGVAHKIERFGDKIVSTRFFWTNPGAARHPAIPNPIPFDFDPDDPAQNPVVYTEVVGDIGPGGLGWKAGEWHHVAITWSDLAGAGSPSPTLQELFLDGERQGGFDAAGVPQDAAFRLRAVEVETTVNEFTQTTSSSSESTSTITHTFSTAGYDWDGGEDIFPDLQLLGATDTNGDGFPEFPIDLDWDGNPDFMFDLANPQLPMDFDYDGVVDQVLDPNDPNMVLEVVAYGEGWLVPLEMELQWGNTVEDIESWGGMIYEFSLADPQIPFDFDWDGVPDQWVTPDDEFIDYDWDGDGVVDWQEPNDWRFGPYGIPWDLVWNINGLWQAMSDTSGYGSAWIYGDNGEVVVIGDTVDDLVGVNLDSTLEQQVVTTTTTTNIRNVTQIIKNFEITRVMLRTHDAGEFVELGGYSYTPSEDVSVVRTGQRTGAGVQERFTNATFDDLRVYSDVVDFDGVAQAEKARYAADSAVFPATITGRMTFPRGVRVGTVTATVLYPEIGDDDVDPATIDEITDVLEMRAIYGAGAGDVPSLPFDVTDQPMMGNAQASLAPEDPFFGGPVASGTPNPRTATGELFYAFQWKGLDVADYWKKNGHEAPFALLEVTATAVGSPVFLDRR